MLNGAALADCTPEQAAKTFDEARRAGVNSLDVPADDADAESRLGPMLEEHRDGLFVAAGTLRTDADDVKRQIDDSLGRLGVDHIDLHLLHGLETLADLDAHTASYAAADAAREAGVTRFVGLAGRSAGAPSVQLAAIRRWQVDTVRFSLNPRLWSLAEYRRDVNALLSECRARGLGVQVTDVIARGPWPAEQRAHRTWYRPYTDEDRIKAAVDFVMSIPGVHCLLTPADRMLVGPTIAAADRPTFLSERRRRAIVERFADDTPIFDSDPHTGPAAGPG